MLTLFTQLLGIVLSVASLSVPRAEYPRPQFERSDWQTLNGEWTFTLGEGDKASKGFDGSITVPFAPQSKLSGIGNTDFIKECWYQRDIQMPSEWKGKRVMLNFGAVYYESTLYIDGKFVGYHCGGSDPFAYDITPFVEDGASHSLVLEVRSDLLSGVQPGGKQSHEQESYGCFYTRTTGIWQSVWMEAVDAYGLKGVGIVPDIDINTVTITPTYYNIAKGQTISISVLDGKKRVAKFSGDATEGLPIQMKIRKPKLWSPENPHLYTLALEVKDANGKVLDKVSSYFGMRKISIEGTHILLNNEPYFQRLVLDQGFYPDGVWTAPSDEALKADIEMSMAVGFNGARLHQKVFEERFYYWADKLGYLVWSEMASWGMDASNPVAGRNFTSEWTNIVEAKRNHPSIVAWTPFNEEWSPSKEGGRLYTDVYYLTKKLDPTRPVNTISGGVYVISDFCTAHDYTQNGATLHNIIYNGSEFCQPYGPKTSAEMTILHYDGAVPYILDEFGGIKCAETQEDDGNSWGYGDSAKTREEFYSRLESQVKAIVDHGDKVCGFCYTQLTDVEQEQNGIYYYDRSAKYDSERVRKIFQMPALGY